MKTNEKIANLEEVLLNQIKTKVCVCVCGIYFNANEKATVLCNIVHICNDYKNTIQVPFQGKDHCICEYFSFILV